KLMDVEKEQGATNYWMSKDGRWLCMTEIYGNCAVWDMATGKRQFHKRLDVEGSRWIRENVLTTYNGSRIDRYDVRTRELLSHNMTKPHLNGATGNRAGTVWAGYSEENKAVELWDMEKDEFLGVTIPCDWHDWGGSAAAISDDGKQFIYHVAHGPTVF